MQSKATTIQQYLSELPADRRAAISIVRDVILKNLDRDYQEGMSYGMIGYSVPHRVYPPGYHCDPSQPLPFAGLASQKNHMSLYLMSVYGDGEHWNWFRDAWARSGKKLDMGKCCIRFKKVDDLALDVIAEALRKTPAKTYIAHYESAIRSKNKAAAKKAATTPAAPKTATAKKATAKKVSAKEVSAKQVSAKKVSAKKSARPVAIPSRSAATKSGTAAAKRSSAPATKKSPKRAAR